MACCKKFVKYLFSYQCPKRFLNDEYIGLSCFPSSEYTLSFNPPVNTGDPQILIMNTQGRHTKEPPQGATPRSVPREPNQGYTLGSRNYTAVKIMEVDCE